jgi:hypothetical protein
LDFSEVLNKVYSNYEKVKGYSLVKPLKQNLGKYKSKNSLGNKKKDKETKLDKSTSTAKPKKTNIAKRHSFVCNNVNKRNFLECFKDVCINMSNCHNLEVVKLDDDNYSLSNSGALKNRLTYQDVLRKFPWGLVNKRFNSSENRDIFHRIIKSEADFIKLMDKYTEYGNPQATTLFNGFDDSLLYCYCKKQFLGGLCDQMLGNI